MPCGRWLQVFVTPYLWLSGLDATIKTPLLGRPEVNTDVSAVDMLSHLSAVPFLNPGALPEASTNFDYGKRRL
jgi:hypothetical protein